jgi:hypothetical protein
MLWVAVACIVTVVGVYLWGQARRRAGQREIYELASRVQAQRERQSSDHPDLGFAAKGFAAIALMKANAVAVDLHDAEYALAENARKEGATLHQALSLRWGGVQAIHTDPQLYSMAVAAAEDAGSADRYHHGAAAHLAMVLHQCPEDFATFRAHMRGF